MGPAFLPYAGPIFERCSSIVHTSLLQYQAYQQNPDMDEPDRSFLVVALDLLSGLTQGLGMALENSISRSQPNLLSLLTICLKHPQAPVRQSAYALVGDLAMNCFPLLKPHMPAVMAELIVQLDPEPKVEFISACNNAAWSVGEVALRYGRGQYLRSSMMLTLVLRHYQMNQSSNNGCTYWYRGLFRSFSTPRLPAASTRTLLCQ